MKGEKGEKRGKLGAEKDISPQRSVRYAQGRLRDRRESEKNYFSPFPLHPSHF
jgi:hypothetical protein